MQANAQRLKEYRSSIVLFPRRSGKPKNGDSSKDDLSAVQQHTGALLPIKHDKHQLETVTISSEQKASTSTAAFKLDPQCSRRSISSGLIVL